MNTIKKTLRISLIILIATNTLISAEEAVVIPAEKAPQVKGRYTAPGTVELGGSIGFSSTTITNKVGSNSVTGSATNQFLASPQIAFFPVQSLSLGVTSQFVVVGGLYTSYGVYFSPGYVFDTKSIAYPYISGLIGYANLSYNGANFSQSGIGYGGRVGVKIEIATHALLDIGLQYTVQNYSEARIGAFTIYGYSNNVFATTVGCSIWF